MLVRSAFLMPSFLVIAAAVAFSAAAEDTKPQIERAILERHDQSSVSGKEIVSGTVVLGAGAVVGFHTHSGDEAGYVVKGSIVWKVRGQPDKTVKTGESFFNPRGSVHSIVGGAGGATVFSAWVVDKGKPLVEPVP
jgi:quercetin dioxygenase-like cupin family protein